MRAWIFCFSLGIFCAGFIPALPDRVTLLLLLLPLLFSFWLKRLYLAAAFSLGILCLLWQAISHQQSIIPHRYEQQDLWLTGQVSGLPQQRDGNTRMIFVADTLCAEAVLENCQSFTNLSDLPDLSGKSELRLTRRILLNDYSANSYIPGQYWRLKVSLKRPHGFSNPGSFDYERWLFQERISATGYVRDDVQNSLLNQAGHWQVLSISNYFRFTVQEYLKQLPLQSPGFIAALMIGDRFLISNQQWDLLTTTGTNHLMVISGLHIGLVAWLVFGLSFTLCRLFPGFCLLISINRFAAVMALLAAVFYAALAGFSLPVQRALVMVCCLMSGHILVRQVAPSNNLCIALFLVLLLDPMAAQTAGFWLSFFAVFVLLLFFFVPQNEASHTMFDRVKTLLRCQLYLFIGMLPLMLLFFGQVSLLAPLVNIVAIPFVGLLIVPLCLLCLVIFPLSSELFSELVVIADFLLILYTDALGWLTTSATIVLVPFPSIPLWLIALLLVIMITQFFYKAFFARFVAIAILIACFFYKGKRPPEGEFILDILDVGQGLATVITTRNHLMIYDTGPAYSPRFNAGSGIILPFLRAQNLGDVDLIMVSHGDNDHAGGLSSLEDFFPETKILGSDQTISQQTISGQTTTGPCKAGQQWRWDQIDFEVLAPLAQSAQESGNNRSCVLKISTAGATVLLPGDIEQESELNLLKTSRDRLSADILIAPHHGSATSSTGLFIRAVDPDYVIFSAGYLNRFNHPHPDVRMRYQRFNSEILDTSETGAIRFRISPSGGIQGPEKDREVRPRFWHLR